jgi:hypothetical protein
MILHRSVLLHAAPERVACAFMRRKLKFPQFRAWKGFVHEWFSER